MHLCIIQTTYINTSVFAGQVLVSGPGVEKSGVVVGRQTEFTVDARQAGTATLLVSAVDVDGTRTEVTVVDNKNGTYTCRYTATRAVKYSVSVTWGGVSVPKSPFKVGGCLLIDWLFVGLCACLCGLYPSCVGSVCKCKLGSGLKHNLNFKLYYINN